MSTPNYDVYYFIRKFVTPPWVKLTCSVTTNAAKLLSEMEKP